MKFTFVPLTLAYINQIKTWKYNGFVKTIYVEPYLKSYNQTTGEMKGPGDCTGFAVLNQGKLIGLFEYYFKDEIMEVGLALQPEMTGKGLGRDFVVQGISFGIERFNYQKQFVKLTVNVENKPAVIVYQKAGFKEYERKKDEIEMRKKL